MIKQEILQGIRQQGILPLFYHDDFNACLLIVRSLYDAGMRVVKYTNRGEAALENYRRLIGEAEQNMPDLRIGIGTIKTRKDASVFLKHAHISLCHLSLQMNWLRSRSVGVFLDSGMYDAN